MQNTPASIGFYRFAQRGLLVVALVFCWAANASANSETQHADVRVVIDVSGSMKQNDPSNLRRPALELLVKLLPEHSKSGVWAFGKYVNMLVPHKEVNDNWRGTALAQAEKINSTGLFTNIGEALDKAAYDRHQPRGDYRTSIILLTDGMVDISREPADNKAEWRRIVDELLPELKASGYTIHTIALSDIADRELMDKLALSTDGISAVAKSADDLMRIFLEAFDAAVPAERLPLDDNSFVVDSSVEEFTALIFRKPGSQELELVSPDGETYRFEEENAYVNWYRTEEYDLITVERPLEGEWLARAELEPDSRVTVVSNLNLVVKPIKHNLFRGDAAELSLLFRESGKTVQDPSFLGLLDISYQLIHRETARKWEEDLSGDALPSNGIFAASLDQFKEEGYYDLSVMVDGKTFKREFSHTVAVREAFSLSLENAEDSAATHLKVQSFGENIDYARTNVVARIRDPRGVSSIQAFSLTDSDSWSYTLVPDIEGIYDIHVRVTATDKSGGQFEFDPAPVQIRHPASDNPFAESTNAAPSVQAPEAEAEAEAQTVASVDEVDSAEAPVSDVPDEDSSNLWLYIALAAGNVLIIALAFVAYRTIMGSRKDPELEELEKAVEEVKAPKPAAAAEENSPPPNMADVDAPLDEEEPAPSFDAHELSNELQIDEDDEPRDSEADQPAISESDQAATQDEDDEDLGVADLQFSLDDFTDDEDEGEDKS